MLITSLLPTDKFTITAVPEWPSVVFTTDESGPHTWNWTVVWDRYTDSGTATTPGNTWDAKPAVTDKGGKLTVTAAAAGGTAAVTVQVVGTNPPLADVLAYLAPKPDSAGFDRLIAHESRGRNFAATGLPLKSFDNGYGMCQLTKPPPDTAAKVWNWKKHVDAGLAHFATCRASAVAYLTQSGRTYTADQLRYEAVCRWNGGHYHIWDGTGWVRDPKVLCDSATGNIGWDMTDADNKGKTEAELRKRDSGTYNDPKGANGKKTAANKWKYFGVCYVDAILGHP